MPKHVGKVTSMWAQKMVKMFAQKLKSKHLHDVNMSYMQHLYQAITIAMILLVHGLCPYIWPNKATLLLCRRKT